MVFNATFNNNH